MTDAAEVLIPDWFDFSRWRRLTNRGLLAPYNDREFVGFRGVRPA